MIFSQVGIGTSTPDPSAILDLTVTTKGMLLSRMTTTERDANRNLLQIFKSYTVFELLE